MINFKSKLSKKEELEVKMLLQKFLDKYGDFYITKNNLRLFIQDNLHLLFKGLSKGDYIAFNENGIGLVIGFSDNSPRKYLKILTDDMNVANNIIKAFIMNLNCDLYSKIKRNNPIKDVLLKNGFLSQAGRGKEELFKLER